MRTSIKYILFISIFAALGFSREFVFVNINSQLFHLYYKSSDYNLPHSLSFLNGIDYLTLYYLKYPLTVLYFMAYLGTSYYAAIAICAIKKNARWVVYIYALLLVLSSVSMAYNYVINHQLSGDEYTFSRWLMGIAQSPLVAFFVIASNKLFKNIQTEQ